MRYILLYYKALEIFWLSRKCLPNMILGKTRISAQFFNIAVGKLSGPDDLLLQKYLMILIISSGVIR